MLTRELIAAGLGCITIVFGTEPAVVALGGVIGLVGLLPMLIREARRAG